MHGVARIVPWLCGLDRAVCTHVASNEFQSAGGAGLL